jgi:hypothetical protein
VISRLEALEARVETAPPQFLRTGWLAAALPPDYVRERHFVVVKREPTGSPNIEWREFEERARPAPPGFSDDYVSGEGAA